MKYNEIKTAPWNTRGEITPESVKKLAESIDAQGLINPITLWQDADGQWLCIAGNRRLAALRTLNTKNIELPSDHYTVFGGTWHEAMMLTVVENLQREDVGVIEEAALIEQCLEDGMTAEQIAAKTGHPVSWVNRRRRLITLDDAWKSSALPTKDLEMMAALPPEAQKRLAKGNATAKSINEFRWAFERELRDLDCCKWCGAKCKKCDRRTGVQPDLFGETDGKLGRCMDVKCYEETLKEYVEAQVAKIAGGAETHKVSSSWLLPSGKGTSNKKTKQCPCLWWSPLYSYSGEIQTIWSESPKDKAEREKREEEKREQERRDRAIERERDDNITNALDEGVAEVENQIKEKFTSYIDHTKTDENGEAWMVDSLFDKVNEWHSNEEWADIIRTFPWLATLCGLSKDDVDYFLEKHPESEEEDEDE